MHKKYFLIIIVLSFILLLNALPVHIAPDSSGEVYFSISWYEGYMNDGYAALVKSNNNGEDLELIIHTQSPSWVFGNDGGPYTYPNLIPDATPDVLYSFLDSKLWYSNDSGFNWNLLNELDGNFFSGAIGGVIYRQRNGIHRSIDYGQNFNFVAWSNGVVLKDIGNLEGELYGISGGLYPNPHILKYSSDYGVSFIQQCVIEDQIPETQNYYSVHRGNLQGELYLLTKDAQEHYYIYRSTDYGQSFTLKHQTEIFVSFYWLPFFKAGVNPGECYYAVSAPNFSSSILRIFYSDDYGQTFTEFYHELWKDSFPADTYQVMFIQYNNLDNHYFMNTDIYLQFTENHLEFEMTTHSYCHKPTIVGNLPTGIENIADRYWSVTSFPENPGSSYNISFDLTNFVYGIENFETLHFLTRDDDQSEWQDVIDLGATIVYNYPYENFITIQGLDSFSDFVPAGGNDNPLPVELSSFTAIQTSLNFAQINWTTQSESNLLGYNVYRNETENINNSIILNTSFINPTNTSSTQYYSYNDEDVEFEQTYFYWLESVELDGNTELYGPTSLTIESPEVVNLPNATVLNSAYPNPFNPTTTIEFDIKENETGVFSIFNLKGQIVTSESFDAGNHSFMWKADKCSSGVYFYKLHSASYSKVNKILLLK